MSEYFPEPNALGVGVKIELDLSNYAAKANLKNTTGIDASKFAKKSDLANLKFEVNKLDTDELKKASLNLNNLKSKVYKLDVNKLVLIAVDLSKPSNVVKYDVLKKDIMLKSKILKIK